VVKLSSFRWFFILMLTVLLCACYVPGNYISESGAEAGYRIGDKTVYPDIIELDANWVAQNQTSNPYIYRVGPYDILNIIVWNNPELTTPATQMSSPTDSGILVNSEGYIYFPFAGSIDVNHKSMTEIQDLISEKISYYIRDPKVSVRVVDFRSQEVQVLGDVGGVGRIFLEDRPLSLFDALSESGGVDLFSANTTHIFVIRGTVDNLKVFWVNTQVASNMMAAQKFYLQNNDLVYVPPSGLSDWNKVLSQVLPFAGIKDTSENLVD
jgi:protein involved in polysaccharide export with SLBB domain